MRPPSRPEYRILRGWGWGGSWKTLRWRWAWPIARAGGAVAPRAPSSLALRAAPFAGVSLAGDPRGPGQGAASHPPGSGSCYGGRGRTSDLKDRIALFSPMSPHPKDRQHGAGSGILLLGTDGFPSCARFPAASFGVRGSHHLAYGLKPDGFVSWPSWGHDTEAFPSSCFNFESSIKPGYKIAEVSPITWLSVGYRTFVLFFSWSFKNNSGETFT